MGTETPKTLEQIEEFARCLGISPEEIMFLMEHFDMPYDPEPFGLWAKDHLHIIIQACSGLFYDQAQSEFAKNNIDL